jgi:hypothetical protein
MVRLGQTIIVGALVGACVDPAGPIPDNSSSAVSLQPETNPDEAPPDDGAPVGTGAGGGGVEPEFVSFDADIHPILVENCGQCHSTPGGALPGHAAAAPEDAFAEVHAESNGEPVYMRILTRTSGDAAFMPPQCGGAPGTPGCLTAEEYDLIERWVEEGASNR